MSEENLENAIRDMHSTLEMLDGRNHDAVICTGCGKLHLWVISITPTNHNKWIGVNNFND